MRLYQKFHYDELYRFFRTDFWQFELSAWLHVFGQSLISVFIPIILLKTGYSLNEVILFYLIFNIFNLPLNFFAHFFTYRFGAKKATALGTIAYIIFFILFYSLTPGNWPLLIFMAFFVSLYDALYWVSHIYFFVKCSPHKNNIQRDNSLLYIAKKFAGVLAPLFGALIIIFTTEHILILCSIIILILSLWPLFQIRDIDDRPKHPPVSFRAFFSSWRDLKEYLITAFNSFHVVAEGMIWPIYIYTIFESVQSVAAIPIIVSLTTMIFTYFSGHVKKSNRETMIVTGAALIALTWITRLLFSNAIFYFITIFLIGLFTILISLPLESTIFEKAEKKDILTASTYRNLFAMAPRILFYGVLYLIINVFPVSFIAAAAGMFIIIFLSLIVFPPDKLKSVKNDA